MKDWSPHLSGLRSISRFFPSMATDLSVEWLETSTDPKPPSSPKPLARDGLSPAISIYSNSTPRRRTISFLSARGLGSHTACYEMAKDGRFRACLKNSSRRREEAERRAILAPKSASSRRRLRQPAIDVGSNEVIVIQVWVSRANAIDFFNLTG